MVVAKAVLVKQGMKKDNIFEPPYGAPEHRKALGVRPEGIANRMLATGPRGKDGALGQRREPKTADARISASLGRPSLWLLSLGRARESNPPAVRGTASKYAAEGGSTKTKAAKGGF
jgi:hypothetical protein